MTIDEIEARWRKQLKGARRTSQMTRIWIGLIMFVGALSCIGTFAAGINLLTSPPSGISSVTAQALGIFEMVLAAINAYLILVVLLGVQRFVRARVALDTDQERFPPLSDTSRQLVEGLLAQPCDRMSLKGRSFVFVKPKNSNSMSPSVVEKSDGTILMVVPVDFLTTCNAYPERARAMLAHEMGHVAQQDTKLWLYATAFAEELMRVFLPFNMSIAGLLILEGLIILGVRGVDQGLSTALMLFASGIPGIVSLFFFYNRIRRYRRKSEELADLAAWIFAGSDDGSLESCFRMVEGAKTAEKVPTDEDILSAFGFFGEGAVGKWAVKIHPKPLQRLKQVQHYRELVEGKTRKLRLTRYTTGLEYSALGLPLVVIAILFPVFAQAKEAAKKMSCMSNEKQISLAAAIYSSDNDDEFPGNLDSQGKDAPDSSAPGVRSWAVALKVYTKSSGLLICPSAYTQPEPNADPYLSTSYLYNGIINRETESQIPELSQIILLRESNAAGPANEAPCRVPGNPTYATHFNRSTFDLRHAKGGNIAFTDSHAKFLPKSSLTYSMFGVSKAEDGPLETDTAKADGSYGRTRSLSEELKQSRF